MLQNELTFVRYLLTSLYCTILLASNLSAEPGLLINSGNISHFKQYKETKPYFTCYIKSASNTNALGILNKPLTTAEGIIWRQQSEQSLRKGLSKLKAKIRNVQGPEKVSIKRRIAALKVDIRNFPTYLNQCSNESLNSPTPTPTQDFLGDSASLKPYRDQISLPEVRHLLRNVAFGGSPELEALGMNQGLSKLVDALVDPPSLDQTVEDEAKFWEQRNWHYDKTDPQFSKDRIVTAMSVQVPQIYRMIFSNHPLKEWMTLQLSAHFATNLDGIGFSYSQYSGYGLNQHVDLIRNNALGSIEDITKGMLLDPAMNEWLDNQENHVGFPNQNFARELLELFILGAVDPITKVQNYTEESVIATTAFVSGYRESTGIDPITKRSIGSITFDQSLHDPAKYTVFRGIAGAESTNAFTPNEIIEHTLYKHPGSPRYLAERFAGLMLYPGLPDSIVSGLAAQLKNDKYQLKTFLKIVLKSSAMFSSKAVNSCITSPLEQAIRILRSIRPARFPRETEERAQLADYFFWMFSNYTSRAGQMLFQPPSVFGWKGSCNINRNGTVSFGEGWSTLQQSLYRSHFCFGLNNALNNFEFDWRERFGFGTRITTIEGIIQTLAKEVFDIKLSDEEQTTIAKMLTVTVDDNGQVVPLDISFENNWWLQTRVGRTICAMADLPKANRR